LLPLAGALQADGEAATSPAAPVARTQKPGSKETGLLVDAGSDPEATATLLELMAERRRLKGLHGHLIGLSAPGLGDIIESSTQWHGVPTRVDLHDSYVVFGDRMILKLLRRLQSGIHPDVEIGRFLARSDVAFPQAPRLLGSLEYRGATDEPVTVGLLHEYVPNTVPAWQFAQDSLLRFCEQVMAQPAAARPGAASLARASLWDLAAGETPPLAKELLGGVLEWATLLGRRTGELHLALSSQPSDPSFTPEPFTQLHQRSLYQSARKLLLKTFQQLRAQIKSLPAPAQELAHTVLGRERQVLERLRAIVGPKILATRIRCHGNFHLGQVLYTGKDFLFADFGGEPTLPLSARRIKQSPIDDLAGMVHSFQYAASQMLTQLPKLGITGSDTVAAWQNAARFWSLWSGSAFLRAYAATTTHSDLLPKSRSQWDLLLQFYLLEEAVYELRYNLVGAADQVAVPLERIQELIDQA
jgi:maltose alpha-D-glucosyltransferase/alpha-amylase